MHHHFTPEDWERLRARPEFEQLLLAKRRFIIPAVIFFVVYYFALPILVGYFPAVMSRPVGPVNLAYTFALSQFFVAWLIMALYLRASRRFDELEAAMIAHIRGEYKEQ